MSKTLKLLIPGTHNASASADANGQYPVSFIRKRLEANEVYATSERYNTSTGQVEFSPDGGATWVPASGLDPRTMTLLPALTGSDVRCRSAASSVRFIKDTVDEMVLAGSAAEAASAIATGLIAALIVLGPFDVLFALALVTVFALIDVTWVVIAAALTSTVYGHLTCILTCHEDINGRLDATSFAAVQADIDAVIGGTSAGILHLMLNIMGYGGLNNAAAKALATADCSGCGCDWCYTFDFTASNGGWTTVTQGTYVAGSGWHDANLHSGTNQYRALNLNKNCSSTTLTHVLMEYDFVQGFCNLGTDVSLGFWKGAYATAMFAFTNCATPNPHLAEWAGSIAGVTQMRLQLMCGGRANSSVDPGGSVNLRRVTLRGTGTNPFGSNNC